MATPAEVIDLFADVREGSSFERARAAANAFRAFGSLSAADKRDLAVLVAERAAPQLVPRIQAETGLDLTREQVQAVIDMAGRMDADDIEELRHAVRNEQDTRTPTGAVPAPTEEDEAPSDAAGPETPEPGQAEPEQPELDVDGSELDALGVESELLELDLEPEPSASVAPAPEPRPFESIFDDLPSLPDLDQRAAGGTVTTDAVGVALSDLEPAPATVDLTARVRAARHPLVELLADQATGAGCVRVVRAHVDDLADMDAAGRTAVVDAIPDGWARRRALQAMLEAQVLPADDVPDLIRQVGSPVARTWLCATAIETDVLDVDQLGDLLEPRAATRLRGRYR